MAGSKDLTTRKHSIYFSGQGITLNSTSITSFLVETHTSMGSLGIVKSDSTANTGDWIEFMTKSARWAGVRWKAKTKTAPPPRWRLSASRKRRKGKTFGTNTGHQIFILNHFTDNNSNGARQFSEQICLSTG